MTRPTKAQTREAARIAGGLRGRTKAQQDVLVRNLRQFAEALDLIRDRDQTALERYVRDFEEGMLAQVNADPDSTGYDDDGMPLDDEAPAEVPDPTAGMVRDYIQNDHHGTMTLHIAAGEGIDGNSSRAAQWFGSAGTYTIPAGMSCVWLHPPTRTRDSLTWSAQHYNGTVVHDPHQGTTTATYDPPPDLVSGTSEPDKPDEVVLQRTHGSDDTPHVWEELALDMLGAAKDLDLEGCTLRVAQRGHLRQIELEGPDRPPKVRMLTCRLWDDLMAAAARGTA